MSSFQWNSLQDLVAIQEKMNRLFEETIHRTEFPDEGVETALWSPAADVYETPEEIILQVELPGRPPAGRAGSRRSTGKLRVSGHRRANPDVEPEHFVRMERIYGRFLARIRDPRVDRSVEDQGEPEGGVLKIVAARSERRADPGEARPRQVPMTAAAGQECLPHRRRSPSVSGSIPRLSALYEREGLLRPVRDRKATPGSTTPTPIERLEIILTLTRDLGVNLAGVEVILHMKEKIERMQGDVHHLLSRSCARRWRPAAWSRTGATP